VAEKMRLEKIDPEKLAEIYEHTGKVMKAKLLRKEIKKVEKK